MNKALMVIGLVTAIGGLIFILLPHNAHYTITGLVTFGQAGYEQSHEQHETIGYIFVLLGITGGIIGWILKD